MLTYTPSAHCAPTVGSLSPIGALARALAPAESVSGRDQKRMNARGLLTYHVMAATFEGIDELCGSGGIDETQSRRQQLRQPVDRKPFTRPFC
ncbi:hypothetical protein EK904_005320 [Melospiza melodia maxima]|nr:hypothetical protein EK904_005320 [Melospiza melodia maxima]